MNETWKAVPGFEGLYEVSDRGRVCSVARTCADTVGRKRKLPRRVFNPSLNRDGYPKVCLRKNGSEFTMFVHRLVALAFIPNPDGKPDINHKDGVKTNANVENLEWCNASENRLHCCRVLGHYNGQPKRRVWCKETDTVYGSIHEAATVLGLNAGCILQVCRGIYTNTGGLHFEFVPDDLAAV